MKPMLAEDVISFETLTYPLLGSFKVDGVRALMINGQFKPRSLKDFKNVATVAHFNKLAKWLDQFDGELTLGSVPTGSTLCRLTSAAMNTIEGTPEIHWWIFDLVNVGYSYAERVKLLKQRFNDIPAVARKAMRIHLLEQRLLRNAAEAEAMEAEAIELGYEGLVLKSPDGVYKFGRSTLRSQQFLRVKRFTDGEGEIVGFEEQKKNNNAAKKSALGHITRSSHKANKVGKATLGVLQVRILSGEWKGVLVNLMGGWDQAEGLEIWNNRPKYMGKIAKLRYFGHGCKDKPRFATYLGIRDKTDMS